QPPADPSHCYTPPEVEPNMTTLSVGITRAMMSALLPLLLCGTMAALDAQEKANSGAVAAITKLEHEQVKAILGNERAFIEKYMADDFVGGTSFGNWETKADQLKDASNPQNKTN